MKSSDLFFCIKSLENVGGAERVLVDLANGFVDRGKVVTVLSYDEPEVKSFYELDSRVEWLPLGIGSTSKSAKLIETLERIRALRRVITKRRPGVVIGFMHSMFIPLGLALLATPIPLIASEHIVPEHYKSRPLEKILLYLVPLFAKRITCVSKQVRSSYSPFLQRKMVSVVNPVNIDACGQAAVSGQQRPRKILLTVGRLAPQKDHVTLLEAFAQIADHLPTWDLRIVGDGELRQELESKVAELGLGERVFLPGSIKDIAAEYLAAQLFVQPSRYESFGLTTAEALAHGLPAVGFNDCKGTNQLIIPGVNGDLADGYGDRVTSLAHTLKALMADDTLRVSLSRRTGDTLNDYQLENVLNCWETIISEVT